MCLTAVVSFRAISSLLVMLMIRVAVVQPNDKKRKNMDRFVFHTTHLRFQKSSRDSKARFGVGYPVADKNRVYFSAAMADQLWS
jgi:hypothetical protein